MDAVARASTPPESGEKKLPTESNPSQSPSGRLVYVRRRVEVVDTSNKESSNRQHPSKSCLVSSSSSTPSDWEERYHHLQVLLDKLNRSDRTDHLQMLWSLSSAELSKHAVDLEKRSIQFSLEEGTQSVWQRLRLDHNRFDIDPTREMQRVAALNVLGKSLNILKSTSNDGERE